jgi:hypothetical protein
LDHWVRGRLVRIRGWRRLLQVDRHRREEARHGARAFWQFRSGLYRHSSKSGQSRCIRQGNLPAAAYYSAWYYVPHLARLVQTTDSTAPDFSGWNLFHFQGITTGENYPGENFHWDVSLVNKDSGALRLEVFSYQFPPSPPDQSNHPSIPIGAWFKIEMYLKRAADETGEVIVYQDDAVIFQLSNLVTDRSNSPFGQWYVGNLAKNLDPPESTVYVDDITISATR